MDEKQRECFTKAYDKAAELILKATDEFTEKFPPSASVNNFYQPDINYEWTPGFWTGEVWLAWEKTGNEKLKKTVRLLSNVLTAKEVAKSAGPTLIRLHLSAPVSPRPPPRKPG